MALPEVSSSPQISDYNLAISKDSRKQSGIGQPSDGQWNYVDAWNQARMAQYNNDYNYWLWQQQAEYNSPSNQVARLKQAGLNPNFNSIDGTGNLGSMPTSQANLSPSIGSNKARLTQARTQAVLGGLNAFLSSVGQGVDTVSKLSDLPPLSSMGEYRKLLLQQLKNTVTGKDYDNIKKMLDGLTSFVANGGQLDGPLTVNLPYVHSSSASQFFVFDPREAVDLKVAQQRLKNLGFDADIKELIKEYKEFEKTNIWHNEKVSAEGRAGLARAGSVLNKLAEGEHVSWREILAAILALGVMKL